MKRSITTAFPPPNNNTGVPDDDADNAPAPNRVAPTMRVTTATPDPMATAGPSQPIPVQDLGPTTQPLLVSRGQATVTPQAAGSTQDKSMQGIDVNLADQDGRTPLMLAIQDGDLPTVQALLSHGANVNATDNDGWTPLMSAAEYGHLPIIEVLLSAPGIDMDAKQSDGTTALIFAAFRGKDDVAKALIHKGANVNATDNDGWTPLMSAAKKGHLTTVQALLSAPKIDVDVKNPNGTTALYIAAAKGEYDLVKVLINKGANVNATDDDGWTALIYAALIGYLRTVQALLSAPGIDINARNDFGQNALYLAAFHKIDDIAIMLIENGADISQLYKKIKTADYSDEEQHLPSLDYLMHYLAQRQADVGNLSIEATWASIFATSAIPIQGDQTAIPSLQALALDAHIHKTQADGPSLAQMAFQTIRDQLLQQKLSAADVVKLISTFNSSTFATALVQTLAIASELGHYRTESEHQLIFNALQTSGLYGVYEKSQSCLDPDNINRWQVSGQTLLTRAAQAGDQLLVDALIHCGAAHHLHDQHGNNALHAAVKAGKWSVCHHLLALGANPNTSDRSGISTLTYLAQAFAKGDEQAAIIVATLLAPLLARGYRLDRVVKNPDPARPWEKTTIRAILQSNLNRYGSHLGLLYADAINLADANGYTPLMFAAEHGLVAILQVLTTKGANVNLADNKGWTPLMIAAQYGHLTTIEALLNAPGIDIDAKETGGFTALMIAAMHGQHEAVAKLINKGANVNLADNKGWTPLMIAAEKGHPTTMQALLNARGIDIDAKETNGITALMIAATYGKHEAVAKLINKGAKVNATSNDGWTPLMLAAQQGHPTTMQALLSATGIDINAQKADGPTALIVAAANGQHEVVKTLIENGAKVNATNNDGWKPLMFAAEKGHLTTVQALLSVTGIDIDAQKADGATALIVAAANGKDEVVKALINNGANVNAMDNNGSTPLMWALRLGHQTIAQALLDNGAIPNKPTATA